MKKCFALIVALLLLTAVSYGQEDSAEPKEELPLPPALPGTVKPVESPDNSQLPAETPAPPQTIPGLVKGLPPETPVPPQLMPDLIKGLPPAPFPAEPDQPDGNGEAKVENNKDSVAPQPQKPESGNKCNPGSGLMEELDKLIRKFDKARGKEDKELEKELLEKISSVKREIEEKDGECKKVPLFPDFGEKKEGAQGKEGKDGAKPGGKEKGRAGYVEVAKCPGVLITKAKAMKYRQLYNLPEDELIKKGYKEGRKELEPIIKKLDGEIRKESESCDDKFTYPVVPESGREVTDYYKSRMGDVIAGGELDSNKIMELKKLREEIDSLIEELIKSQDEIRVEDVSSLIDKIQISPGKITAETIEVSTTDKTVVASINNKEVQIRPTEKNVIMKDGDYEVAASGISIEEDKVRFKDKEIKSLPSDLAKQNNIKPKAVELVEQGSNVVYSIKLEEKRKLFGLIPVAVEGQLLADATVAGSALLEKTQPWWAFLTTA